MVPLSHGGAVDVAVVERRFSGDRRQQPTRLMSRYVLLGGRRSGGGRRTGENLDVFVDQHGAGIFLAVVAVLALNFLDSWFTVLFLSHGGQELNPVMDFVLRLGTWPFILVKSLGIGVCVLVLAVARNFRFARLGLGVVAGGYSLLICWHLWLYQFLSSVD